MPILGPESGPIPLAPEYIFFPISGRKFPYPKKIQFQNCNAHHFGGIRVNYMNTGNEEIENIGVKI